MIIQAVSPRRQYSRRDASFALFVVVSENPPSPFLSDSSCGLAQLSAFLVDLVLPVLVLRPSILSFLPSHVDPSPATLHCRLAFVKPTIPPSLSPNNRQVSVCARSEEILQRCQSETLRLHDIVDSRLDVIYSACGKSCSVASRRGRSAIGALLNGTCWMAYNLSGGPTDSLVFGSWSLYPYQTGVGGCSWRRSSVRTRIRRC